MDESMQHHWSITTYQESGSECFLLLKLVLSLFGTPQPQFVNVRLTDRQVGLIGQVGHTA